MSTQQSAASYIEQGWALCQFGSGTKGGAAMGTGWNLPDQAIRDPKAIRDGNNIGLLHVPSRTCTLDLDDLDGAISYLEQCGFDLPAALEAEDAVQISSGRPNRGKLLYRIPDDVDPKDMQSVKVVGANGAVLFELRCADSDGKTVQDVLPPSIHPETNKQYEWAGKGDSRNPSTLPPDLLEFWQGLMAQNAPFNASKRDNDDDGGIITSRMIDELRDALTTIPSDDRELWVKLGLALKSLRNGKGLALWMEWSAKSKKFHKADAQRVWGTFRPTNTNHKVVFAEAQRRGWQNPAAHKKISAQPLLSRQIDLGLSDFEPTEFVLDGFVPVGVSAIAGAWGAGKTVNLTALFASVAHLAPAEWGFRPDLRRHVVWITEAPGQTLDTLKSLARAGGAAHWSEFKNWFHLFPALRQSAEEMADEVKTLTEQLTYRNGRDFEVKPVVILDTTAANLDIENESDNSQVSRAMAVLKQALPNIPLVLIGHTPKALIKADVKDMTFRGAGAWEADAAATYFLVHDEEADVRFLAIRKCRFAPTYFEIDFGQEGGSVILDTPWGEPQTKRYLHGVPSRSNGDARKAAVQEMQEQRREQAKDRARSERQQKIMDYIRQCTSDGRLVTRSSIQKANGGKKELLLEAINRLIESGDIQTHPICKQHLDTLGIKINAPYPDAILPADVSFDLFYSTATNGNHL